MAASSIFKGGTKWLNQLKAGELNVPAQAITLNNTANCVLTSSTTGGLLVNNAEVSGAVQNIVNGGGLSVVDVDGVFTISNTDGGGGALDGVVAGTGITITQQGTDEVYLIANAGVLGIDAGAGIAVNDVDGVITITNTAAGDAITLVEGVGINIVEAPPLTYTITNTGAGEAITLVEGVGINIVEAPPLTYTITNTGGGGGGAVNGIVEGTGITVVDDGQGVFTINNSGVLKLTAGDGIEITGTNEDITITNSGGGGDVNTITAGDGIDITDGGNGDFTINNSGVLKLTAGDGMQITGTNADKSINFYAFHSPLTTISQIALLSIPLSPVGTAANWITETVNPVPVPAAGVYLCQWSIFIKGATAGGNYGDFVGEGFVSINAFYGGSANITQIQNQYFSMTTVPQNYLEVSGSSIFPASGAGFITASANCLALSGAGTQFTVEQPFALPHAFVLYRLY